MHQGIDVDHFHRRGHAGQIVGAGAHQFAGGEGQQRPHPLAAAQADIAHRLVQLLRRVLGGGQQAFQRAFHLLLDLGHPGHERFIGH